MEINVYTDEKGNKLFLDYICSSFVSSRFLSTVYLIKKVWNLFIQFYSSLFNFIQVERFMLMYYLYELSDKCCNPLLSFCFFEIIRANKNNCIKQVLTNLKINAFVILILPLNAILFG